MATNTVCSGEILQTKHRRDFQFSGDRYIRVLEMKTAELFALSCELSGLLSGGSGDTRSILRAFGLGLGTAYQLYDDCIDIFGSESEVGKSLGTDLAKGKLTLPILQTWEAAKETSRAELRHIVENWEIASLSRLKEMMVQYDILNRSIDTIRHHHGKAVRALNLLPEDFDVYGLRKLTEYFGARIEALHACG
jgi:octaprenyl-diphosphate synthase